jgi:hypothetical protein
MTTENELRQALAAEAEIMKWSLSMHDVVTAEVVDNVVVLAAARRRRTPLMLSAAAAVVGLVGGGSYLATHRSNNEGRILASGPKAGKVAVSDAANSSIGIVPSGPVSLAGMTLVLPTDLPKTYRLQNVSAMPVGSNTGSPPGMSVRMMILKGATAADRITVTATSLGGDGPKVTIGPETGQLLKVHGVDAQLYDGGSAKDLNWIERGVLYAVAVAAAVPDTEVMKLADSLVPAADGSVAFSLPAPGGYTVVYDGDGNLQSPWSYNLQYVRENLDKPSDDNVGVDVQPSDGGPLDTLRLVGSGFWASKTVKVGSLDGTLEVVDQETIVAESAGTFVGQLVLSWKTADGLIISLNSQGLSETELIAFAESIATVDEANFRAAVGDRLEPKGGFPSPELRSPDFTVPGVITFTGTLDGRAWTLKATPPAPADSPYTDCIQFTSDGTGGMGETCGPTPTDDSFTQMSYGDQTGGRVAEGVVSAKIRRVVVRDADTKADIVAVDTVAGTGGDDRRAYVIAMKPLAKDVKNFMFVALDEKGEIVGTPTPKPAAEYPGNYGDPSVPDLPATTAPPATIYDPGAPVPEESDPTKLPVFATGTLDGRPWELRKPEGLTPEGPICWYLSFAAGGPQFSCGGKSDPKMNLVLVRDRRTFVLANTAADVAKVKATFKDGRVEEVVPTVKGTDRVAVIGVGLNDVLVSVSAVDATGKDTTTVIGSLPGDPTLPFNFGTETSSGGFFAAPATTAAAATTIKP